jgi:putative restriction endonuclease
MTGFVSLLLPVSPKNTVPSSMPLLQQFLDTITRLKRGGGTLGIAPHKPILLLAFTDLFEKGLPTANRIYIDVDLTGAFLENWRLLVDTSHTADFTQPVYHLQNDLLNGHPFWFLQTNPGCDIKGPVKSVNTLARVLDYGYFSPDVFHLLNDPLSRTLIKNALLDTYFPRTKASYLQSKQTGQGYIADLRQYVLNEPEAQYKTVRVVTELEKFVRGGMFQKNVAQEYKSTCCITGMRLQSAYGHTFIDACHIVPFSVSHNDKISNGIALCPNLHRAFDRGLLTINAHYRVQVSAGVIENPGHPYSLKQFNSLAISLPADSRYHPDPVNLEWHGREVFRG